MYYSMSLLIKNFFYKEQNWWDFGVCYIRSRLYIKGCFSKNVTQVDLWGCGILWYLVGSEDMLCLRSSHRGHPIEGSPVI